ncbi:hypothetical protein [Flavobacterium sp. CS20]|uniref:hypothetical protein n=1 Tax=Flavobacterium sp. CS20 TaxID=2775246 RepID=UPI001B39D0BC|nr:hypothetical protein [Flavobacterium sp. CS20]QTY27023.1 hypothetical protein IGB25_14470 [Flavobacterium sp. CS20]
MSKITYFEKQNTILIWVVCIIVLIIILVIGFNVENITNDEGETIPIGLTFFNVALILVAFLLFYDMKIVLSNEYLKVKFGIGVFKKEFKLQEIDQSSIEIYKPSMWYGIGWRYNLKGDMLFNTKFGTAVRFKLKNNNKSYSIVTSNYKELKEKLTKATENTSLENNS